MTSRPSTSTLPVAIVRNRKNLYSKASMALLVVSVLFLAGCIQAEQTEEDLPVDATTQAQIRQDFYTAVRETVEITTVYTGHDPSIYSHRNNRTFDVAEVQPDSDYYPTMGCSKNPDGDSLYMLDLNISDESQDYTSDEYKHMSDRMRSIWEEQGHDVQSITLRTGGIQSVYYTDLGTRVFYLADSSGEVIDVESACVLPEPDRSPTPSTSYPPPYPVKARAPGPWTQDTVLLSSFYPCPEQQATG